MGPRVPVPRWAHGVCNHSHGLVRVKAASWAPQNCTFLPFFPSPWSFFGGGVGGVKIKELFPIFLLQQLMPQPLVLSPPTHPFSFREKSPLSCMDPPVSSAPHPGVRAAPPSSFGAFFRCGRGRKLRPRCHFTAQQPQPEWSWVVWFPVPSSVSPARCPPGSSPRHGG